MVLLSADLINGFYLIRSLFCERSRLSGYLMYIGAMMSVETNSGHLTVVPTQWVEWTSFAATKSLFVWCSFWSRSHKSGSRSVHSTVRVYFHICLDIFSCITEKTDVGIRLEYIIERSGCVVLWHDWTIFVTVISHYLPTHNLGENNDNHNQHRLWKKINNL